MASLHFQIVQAVTSYDRKQEGKKGYNPYALAQYLAAASNVDDYLADGMGAREAIIQAYNGRLLDCVLKACGLAQASVAEHKTWR